MALEMISVLFVDDHAMVRSGFRQLLETSPQFHVVGEAANGEEAFRLYFDLRPDVLLLDLLMPGEGGLATIRRLLSRDANIRIVVLSMFDEPGIVRRAMDVGALGYLSKGASLEELTAAVLAVADGHSYIEARLAEQLQAVELHVNPVDSLTTREFEVFSMLAVGHSVQDVARLLHLSTKTVGAHRTSIMKKLALKNSAELARMAIIWNIVRVPSRI